jgi:hypothetical protein
VLSGYDDKEEMIYLDRPTRALAVLDADLDLSSLKKQLIIDEHYENTLVTAPVTIFLLGQLMVYSSRVDFSLLTYTKNWTFTRLRNPQSFRATLAQIANGKKNTLRECLQCLIYANITEILPACCLAQNDLTILAYTVVISFWIGLRIVLANLVVSCTLTKISWFFSA